MSGRLALAAVSLALAGWAFAWGQPWIAAAAAAAAMLALAGISRAGGSSRRAADGLEVAREEGPEWRTDEPWRLPIEDALDLHAFAPRDIPGVTEEYLRQAHDAGFREVRIIHGRGTGFQRDRVRRLLTDHPLVESFADAPPERGGWGATVVRMREGDVGKRKGV